MNSTVPDKRSRITIDVRPIDAHRRSPDGADVVVMPTIVTAAASVPTSSIATNVFCCRSDTYSSLPRDVDMRVKSAWPDRRRARIPWAFMSSISSRFQENVTFGKDRATWRGWKLARQRLPRLRRQRRGHGFHVAAGLRQEHRHRERRVAVRQIDGLVRVRFRVCHRACRATSASPTDRRRGRMKRRVARVRRIESIAPTALEVDRVEQEHHVVRRRRSRAPSECDRWSSRSPSRSPPPACRARRRSSAAVTCASKYVDASLRKL